MVSTFLIARPQQSPARIFPAIAADFYTQTFDLEAGSPDQQAASFLVALACRDLSQGKLFLARNLSPQEHLTRLLIQHRLGFEAELAACWQRADFYWQQVQNQLKSLMQRDDLWAVLAADIAQNFPEADVLKDPVLLRQRLVEELFIDTHCGFYNGLSSTDKSDATQSEATQSDATQDPIKKGSAPQKTPRDRSFAHITFVEALLPNSSLATDAWLTLLASPWQRQIDRDRTEKNWRAAIKLCRHRLSLYPKSIPYQTELAEVQGADILAGLEKSESEQQALTNARHLEKGIRQFETLAQTYPHNPVMYDYLGNLHHLHAIQLLNGIQIAQGLVAVEKALVYAPYLKEALTTRDRLVEAMNQIQAYVKQMLAQLKQQPNARLNAKGQRLQAQAKKGFTQRDAYLQSAQVTTTQAALKLAQALQVWHKLSGLPPEPTDQQALAMYDSLSQILQQPPPDKASLPDEWQRVGQARSELAALPSEPICAFLEQRLWNTPAATPTITPPPPPPDAPLIVPTQTAPQPSHEPFLPWVFSRQHWGLKTQVAVAIAALLTAGGLGLYELSVRHTRARAYDAILTADRQNQPLAVMDGAATFLSRTPLSGKDAREAHVKSLYTETFVDWFLQQPELPEDNTVQHYAKRYRDLMED
ncbi:MAG: hypothetical protein F6J95_026685 [Leptolyngbya sp. SIO1E4]|nr:hypothetical protein [Leptolyngbya sp. SIO1E4]